MKRVLVCDKVSGGFAGMIERSGIGVDLLDEGERDRLLEKVEGYEGIVVRSATKVTGEVIRRAGRLLVVGRAGIGLDNIDISSCRERGIRVFNTPLSSADSVAEHAVGLLFALLKNLARADRGIKAGLWEKKSLEGSEIMGKTLGVIGFGRIGKRVAKLAGGLGMKVMVFDPYVGKGAIRRKGFRPARFETLVRRSDVVSLHVPFNEETRSMMGEEEFMAMKEGAFLINCSRGGVVDEDALLTALETGRVRGAGLDVFEQEPPPDRRLAGHPNVIATPHIAASTREAQERIGEELARKMVAFLRSVDQRKETLNRK